MERAASHRSDGRTERSARGGSAVSSPAGSVGAPHHPRAGEEDNGKEFSVGIGDAILALLQIKGQTGRTGNLQSKWREV